MFSLVLNHLKTRFVVSLLPGNEAVISTKGAFPHGGVRPQTRHSLSSAATADQCETRGAQLVTVYNHATKSDILDLLLL